MSWTFHRRVKKGRAELLKVQRGLIRQNDLVTLDKVKRPVFKRDRYGTITHYSEVRL